MIRKRDIRAMPIVLLFVTLSITIFYGCGQRGPDIDEIAGITGFVYVEGGTFRMGSVAGESDEAPVRTVELNSFYIGKYPVIQSEWEEVMGSNPAYFNGDDHPVETISWYDAIEYCNRRSEHEGLEPYYIIDKENLDPGNFSTFDNMKWIVTVNPEGSGYRLPTEAEWEYAARGGVDQEISRFSGSNNINVVAWYNYNSDETTHIVGLKDANELGIHDMSGNVWEWCWDWYDDYEREDRDNPLGPGEGVERVRRGGSWKDAGDYHRITYRGTAPPVLRDNTTGLRLVLSIENEEE